MKHFIKIVFLVLALCAVSCQNDDAPAIYEQGSNEDTNQWIYQQMKRYYYWNEGIGGQGDLSAEPKRYFAGLLNAADRFSYAYTSSIQETLPKSVAGKYGFDVSFVTYQEQVFGVILYVLSGSPAERSGLKRGQLITAIGGKPLYYENYEKLYDSLLESEAVILQLTDFSEEEGFSNMRQVTVSQGFTLLQPVYNKVIQQQSRQIGYIAIPHFDVGLAQSLLNVFQGFKNQSVTDVIVDLRYNGGGDISSAAALSILLAPGIQSTNQFIKFKGNRNGGEVNQSFKEALEMNEANVSFDALRNANPLVQKVYILCGSHTASASEIIINNLKPFMEVITIGERTVGKDVASFAITDDRITGQPGWVLYPAIYKIFNALGEGSYSEGILPSSEVDELQKLQIYPLGDIREVLLNQALVSIRGTGDNAGGRTTQSLIKKHYGSQGDPIILKGSKLFTGN